MDEPTARNANCSSSKSIVNKILSLAFFKETDKCKGELCCETEIINEYGKNISSSCNQKYWTKFEKTNIGTHLCIYVLSKFRSLERAARIFYNILMFAYRLTRSINYHPLCTPENENVIQTRFFDKIRTIFECV